MARLLQSVITGLTNGGVYVLIALAFSIIYMTTRTINFAQGEILMVGSFIYFGTAVTLGLPWPVALIMAAAGAMVTGLVVYLLALAPLGKFDPNTNIGWILTTLAMSLMLVEGFRIVVGEDQHRVPTPFRSVFGRTTILDIEPKQYVVLIVGVGLALGLEILHDRTQLGRALRATAHDKATASLLGINTTAMVLYSFGLAGVLAGIGGWLLGPLIFVSSNMGTLIGLKSFVAAVVGGIGSTRGALVGGLTIGVVEQLARAYGAGEWAEAAVFVALILILVLRPTGILGEALIEKV
ncbi:MAG: branched-chain amino acid ABC transporter permease [Acidobacteria bacterium]|nr:branched-chain amino acid ABC transporter permease [Acidobacteriota bacterium]